jgi:DnaB-like helicase C terminal domain/Toprim-like
MNREHGAWKCHRCQEEGSFFSFQERQGDKPERLSRELANRWDVWDYMVDLCMIELLDESDALSYLHDERGFTSRTIAESRLGWIPDNIMDLMLEKWTMTDLKGAGLVSDTNYPLFWHRVLVPYFDRDNVVMLRAKEIGGNILQAKDTSIRLFGSNNIRGHSEVYLCEGEMDAIYLNQLGYPAAAAPGAGSYQEDWNTWFESARRVYVCFDSDDAGRKGSHRTAQMIGSRSRQVEFPIPDKAKSTDTTEFFIRDLHTTDEFDALVSEVRGERIFSIESSLAERDRLLKTEGVKLGLEELDRCLLPGLLPGQLMTILAKTGAGKTALLSQLLHNLSSWTNFEETEGGLAVPTLVLSLEQTKSELADRMERIGRLNIPKLDRPTLGSWYSKVRICDENRVPPEDVPVLVDEFIAEVGEPPKVVMVDYLGYWSRSFPGKSKYEQTSEAVMELKRIAKEFEMSIIAPHQVSRAGRRGERLDMDFARDSGVVEETSDFMLGLFKPGERFLDDEGEEDYSDIEWRKRADTRLEILKSRHGSVGRTLMFYWAPFSLSLIERGSHLERKVEQEWIMADMNMVYEDVMKVHRGLKFI